MKKITETTKEMWNTILIVFTLSLIIIMIISSIQAQKDWKDLEKRQQNQWEFKMELNENNQSKHES